MRKDVKVVVAAACLLLVGLLAYVLFAPGHKTEVADESSTSSTSSSTTDEGAAGGTNPVAPPVTVETQPPQTTGQNPVAPPVTVNLGPTSPTEPATPSPTVSVAIAPATQPAVDSGLPIAPTTPTAATDWDKTLSTGAVATATGTHAGFPGGSSSTLMGTTDASTSTTGGISTGTGPATPSVSFGSTAAGSSAAPSSSSTGSTRTHKVVYGETLSSIAGEYYGNKASYMKIAAANPGIDPNRLKVGTVLKIPALTESSNTNGGSASAAEKAAPGTTYTVKPGDSLQKISSKLYGTSEKWQKIYELNRSTIGGNPQLLKIGQVLKLPESTASAR